MSTGRMMEQPTQLAYVALEDYLVRLINAPVHIEQIRELGADSTGAAAIKAFGYGRPVCIDYRPLNGDDRYAPAQSVVLRQINRNGFGRERDADRFAEAWLDWSTFNDLPRHVHARDIVALRADGALESVADVQDFLLLTEYVPGEVYADDLLRIRDEGACTALDHARAEALAAYLAMIHAVKHDDPLLWRRRLRDLVGHGEGIMGLCDSYPTTFALATPNDLQTIEAAANRWRWQLKSHSVRLSQVHGDFHPFNVLFNGATDFRVLDRSRGAWGEPADDVSCMTINYLFFSLQRYGTLAGPFGAPYTTFWTHYVERSGDHDLLAVIQPWFAWRALVLASPQWYPFISDDVRRKLLTFARQIMHCEQFDWRDINRYLEAT